jgi:hypothetical protein
MDHWLVADAKTALGKPQLWVPEEKIADGWYNLRVGVVVISCWKGDSKKPRCFPFLPCLDTQNVVIEPAENSLLRLARLVLLLSGHQSHQVRSP